MEFEQLYATHAAGLYNLCFRLQGEVERSDRLFADVWKRAYELFPESGDPAINLGRHLAEVYRRTARTGESPGIGLGAAIVGLAPEYRLPLVLRECGGLAYPAIAAALDVPLGTVRARLARARTLLRPHKGPAVDDELLSAYLDGELEANEAVAVESLLQREESWRGRLAGLRADAETARGLAPVALSEVTRDIVYRSVTESFALGAERRRVPRYKRRWMLLAAFVVPCLLTLLYLQSPIHDSRLYLRGDQLALRAGRSGEKSLLPRLKRWVSPPLWGDREKEGQTSLSFQVDAGDASSRTITALVEYDFEGDLQVDRVEEYGPEELDDHTGWERFRPPAKSTRGPLQDFRGGRVAITLQSRDETAQPLELSGSPGELVLPYRHLREKP